MKNILITLILTLSANLFGCAAQRVIDLRPDDQKNTDTHALLVIPLDIDLVHHNQKLLDIRPPYQQLVSYKLLPGPHTIGLQYNNLVPNEDGVKETIKSHVVQISFTAEQGKEYRIPFKGPDSFSEANSLRENLELQLFVADQLIAVSAVNDLWQTSAPVKPYGLNDIDNADFQTPLTPPADSAAPEQHLAYWWQRATEKERRQFLDRISKDADNPSD